MTDVEALYDTEILDHQNRKDIVRLLTEKPGMNRNQLQAAMGASLGVVDFHLSRLIEEGIILRKPSANDKEVLLFTRRNCHLWNNPETRVLYGGEFTRNVALAIVETPGITTNEISELLDIEPVTVRYHLNKLKDNQLIGGIRVKNTVEYHPTRQLQRWHERIGHVFDAPWDDGDEEETSAAEILEEMEDGDKDEDPQAETEEEDLEAEPEAEAVA